MPLQTARNYSGFGFDSTEKIGPDQAQTTVRLAQRTTSPSAKTYVCFTLPRFRAFSISHRSPIVVRHTRWYQGLQGCQPSSGSCQSVSSFLSSFFYFPFLLVAEAIYLASCITSPPTFLVSSIYIHSSLVSRLSSSPRYYNYCLRCAVGK